MRRAFFALPLVLAAFVFSANAQRTLQLDDLQRINSAGSPEISPDGQWVLYSLSTYNKEADHRDTELREISWDGKQDIQLIASRDSFSDVRWTPDGKISFVSSRPGPAKGSQLWVIDPHRAGEPQQITALKSRFRNYAWSPDGKKIAFIYNENQKNEEADEGAGGGGGRRRGAAAPAGEGAQQEQKPFVEDRYGFKRDVGLGFIGNDDHARVYIYTIATGKIEPLDDRKDVDEGTPTWSHDGTKIAFTSNRDKDPDRTRNSQIYVADAQPNAPLHQITHDESVGQGIIWSKDDKTIAYTVGSETKYNFHNSTRLAIVPSAGGERKVLTESLDRSVNRPEYSDDGKWIKFLVADDQSTYPARVPANGGTIEKLLPPPVVIGSWQEKAGHVVVTKGDDYHPAEIYAWEGQTFRPLVNVNEALFKELKLGKTEAVAFKSTDGVEVHGLLVKPPNYDPSIKYPALIRIHGGPTAQDEHSFNFEHQWFAAQGYLVLSVNYRGSTGRGAAWTQAIYQDWGHKEVDDVLAGADFLVNSGLADPERLGLGGWSYGGVLTDYVITSSTRFKAAISGAGSANHISLYGHDEYTYLYDNEFGPPWKNTDLWLKISYPFFHADRIKTPTLFVGGLNDSNVPVIGGEQLYQALKTLEVPTELLVYPNQNHGFTDQKFIRDRYERYIAWYDHYLKPSDHASNTPTVSSDGGQN